MDKLDAPCPTRYNKVEPSLADLHEQMYVDMLKLRERLMLVSKKTSFTQEEASIISAYSPSTIRKAVKKGELTAQRAGWIARHDLLKWMGYDAIQEFASAICSMEQALGTINHHITINEARARAAEHAADHPSELGVRPVSL